MGRVLAVSDIHGNYDLWRQIREYLGKDDTLYVLGDCADRGADGWAIIKEVISDTRCIYLKGNHEDMLVKAMEEYLAEEYRGIAYQHLISNGGAQTIQDWDAIQNTEFQWKWKQYLKTLPEIMLYENKQGQQVHLCHAGYSPREDEPNPFMGGTQNLIWDRKHYFDRWLGGETYDKTVVVFGHTPAEYVAIDLAMKFKLGEPLWFSKRHKVCIDMGTAWSGCTCLLNLDTWEHKTFLEE